MATIKSSMSALIVTAARPLTSAQVDEVRAGIARQLPADTAVVVVPTGFTVHPLSLAPSTVELQHDRADLVHQQMAFVAEMKKIGGAIEDAINNLGATALRVTE